MANKLIDMRKVRKVITLHHKGKSKMSVINAVRAKLLYRVLAVVKRGTPYKNVA